jgi:hypothetical protein
VIVDIYREVVSAYGRKFNEDQAAAWSRVLGRYQDDKVRAAVIAWQGRAELGSDGRSIGSTVPSPSDVKALIERERAQVQSRQVEALCDDACRLRHGEGYHLNDFLWLLNRYSIELRSGGKRRAWELLDELDDKREGGAPPWRKRCRL